MAIGEFTDRDEALGAVNRLLAADSLAQLLVVFGVTGQGKTRLLEQVAEHPAGRYRPQMVDLQSVVKELRGSDEEVLAGGVEDVAVLLLRDIGMGLARQARWWQRPRRLLRQAEGIGQESIPHRVDVRQQQTVAEDGRIDRSGQRTDIRIGGSAVDTVRRGVWIDQVATVARRLRRRRLLLLVDTCEWMYVFDIPWTPLPLSSTSATTSIPSSWGRIPVFFISPRR